MILWVMLKLISIKLAHFFSANSQGRLWYFSDPNYNIIHLISLWTSQRHFLSVSTWFSFQDLKRTQTYASQSRFQFQLEFEHWPRTISHEFNRHFCRLKSFWTMHGMELPKHRFIIQLCIKLVSYACERDETMSKISKTMGNHRPP